MSGDSLGFVVTAISALPNDVEALKALVASAISRADDAEARLANAKARESATEALIAQGGSHPGRLCLPDAPAEVPQASAQPGVTVTATSGGAFPPPRITPRNGATSA